jgi:hypothetical protein
MILAGVEGAEEARRDWRAQGRGGRGVRQRLRRHDLQGGAGEGGRDLLLDLGGDQGSPGAGEEIPRLGRSDHGQLLRDAELGGLLGRVLRLRAAGRALPDGAEHLFPDQRGEHGPVRAHADHRRQGVLRVLPRRLHRAAARHAPAACRGGGTGRAGRCGDQVFHRPELVPGRRERQGRHLQLRDQARRLPGRPVQGDVDAGGNRLRHHVEIPVLHPARRRFSQGEFYSIAIANNAQQADTGTKMVHLGKNTKSRIVSKGISAGARRTPIAGSCRCTPRPRKGATTPSATAF